MATHIQDRSTYWIISGGLNPNSSYDYRYYWKIYYDQSESTSSNNRSKIIVDYYEQTYGGDIGGPGTIGSPSGTSTCYINGNSIGSISTGGQDILEHTGNSLIYLGSRSTYVPHNNDGSGSFTWQGSGFGFWTSVSTYSVPTIPRSSIISSVSTFDVDDGVTINTTKYVSGFYDRLQIFAGSTLIQTIPHFTSSKVVFTEEKLNNIYAAIPTGSSGTFTFKLSSYTDASFTNQVGSTSEKTAKGNLKIVLPTFNDFSYVDNNAATSALTSGNSTSNVIVKGYSNLKVSISTSQKATANTRGATMSHYLIDGVKTHYSSSATVSKTRNAYSKNSISVTAVDSRDTSSTTVTKSLSVIEYSAVTKNNDYSYSRSNNGVGSQVTLSFSGKWWNGNFGVVTNTISATYKYKRSAASSYTNGGSITLTKNGGSYSFNALVKGDTSDNGFDISESYDIIVTVEDELSSVNINYTIHAGEPAIAIYKNKVAFGAMYDESLGGIQVWDTLYVHGNEITGDIQYRVYSTEERIIGTWIDGKTLYQKVLKFTDGIGSGGIYQTPHNIENVDLIFIENSFFVQTAGDYAGWSYPLPIGLYNSNSDEDKLGAVASRWGVQFFVQTGWSSTWDKYIILNYTKL